MVEAPSTDLLFLFYLSSWDYNDPLNSSIIKLIIDLLKKKKKKRIVLKNMTNIFIVHFLFFFLIFPFFSVYGISFFSFLRQGFCFHWKAPKPVLVKVFLQAQVASTAKLFVKNNSKVSMVGITVKLCWKQTLHFLLFWWGRDTTRKKVPRSSLANGNNLFLLP